MAKALVARVEGFAAGLDPARECTVNLLPPVAPFPAKQIRAILLGLGSTQTEFATLLNVPAVTAIREKTARASPAAPPCACWQWPGITRTRSTRRNPNSWLGENAPSCYIPRMTLKQQIHDLVEGFPEDSPLLVDVCETLRMNRAIGEALDDVREGRTFSAEEFTAKVQERWPRQASA